MFSSRSSINHCYHFCSVHSITKSLLSCVVELWCHFTILQGLLSIMPSSLLAHLKTAKAEINKQEFCVSFHLLSFICIIAASIIFNIIKRKLFSFFKNFIYIKPPIDTNRLANTTATIVINLIKIFIDGPEVSLSRLSNCISNNCL